MGNNCMRKEMKMEKNRNVEYSGRRRRRKSSTVPGSIFTLILLVLVAVFDYLLISSQMLSSNILLPVIIVLFLLVLLVFGLTRRTRKKRFGVGIFIGILMAIVLIYGIVALAKVTGTLSKITSSNTQVTYVGLYVLTDDTAESLSDVADDTFGILSELDRTNTDEALADIEDELGAAPATAEYSGLTALVDALYAQECRVIVLNDAYLDVISEMDGYENVEERIRELYVVKVETESDNTTSGSASDRQFVVYISGIDSRNGLTAKSRSDVNILAVVNRDTHQILLVSTPRDYYVELSISNGQKDKLTHAGIYGVEVSMDTLAMLYDCDVDYYFRVSFDGFEDIVDALGGITVYSEYAFNSSLSSYSYTQGYNDLDGEAALYFVRERYSFSEGDRQRGKNQMAVIQAIVDKAISPDILRNYSSLLSAVEGNFETSVSYDLIASIVSEQLSDGESWNITSYSVDGTGAYEVPYSMSSSAYVMIPDEETVATAKEKIQAVLSGEDPDATEDTE